jgi:hypothetical protein
LITLQAQALNQETRPRLTTKHTNLDYFRQLINERLTLNVPLKTDEYIEAAVKLFNDTIQTPLTEISFWRTSVQIIGILCGPFLQIQISVKAYYPFDQAVNICHF